MGEPTSREETTRPRTATVSGASLAIERPDGTVEQRALDASHLAIGRAADLDIVVDHHTVSRRHAELVRDPFGRFWVRDLRSTNGTTVNGERIDERVLNPGDRIGIGDARLLFRAPAGTGGATLRPPPSEPLLPAIDDGPSSARPSWVRSFRDLGQARLGSDHLAHLLAFGRRLAEIESPSGRLALLCELLVAVPFHGLAAVALRVREGEPDAAVLWGPVGASTAGGAQGDGAADLPYLSRGLLSHVTRTLEPALASSIEGAAAVDVSLVGTPFAAIACPLGPRRADGALDVVYATFPPHVAGAEWVALVELAADAHRHAATAWTARHAVQAHAAIERELETARRIQRALVPPALALPRLEVELGFEPCRWVGGDYVDVVALDGDRVLLAVADVCGKGLQAALVTFSLHTMVRALGSSLAGSPSGTLDLPTLVSRIDGHLGAYLPEDSFATMCVVVLDAATGELESINAGHLPPLVVDADGRARELPSALDPPLGLVPPGVAFVPTTSRGRLEPGETLFLYTDGLTELRNGAREMLGEARLTAGLGRAVQGGEGRPLAAVASGLERLLDLYRGDQLPEDDRGYVLARRR